MRAGAGIRPIKRPKFSRMSDAPESLGRGRIEKSLRERVFRRRPPGKKIELPLGRDNALRGLAQFVRAHIQANGAPLNLGGLGIEIVEYTAQELADNQRVHQHGLVLRVNRMAHAFSVHLTGPARLLSGTKMKSFFGRLFKTGY
jgi:hypothetical protein